jgi:hypothetical protein
VAFASVEIGDGNITKLTAQVLAIDAIDVMDVVDVVGIGL